MKIAELRQGLQVIETTVGMNGYPKCVKKAVIGFDSYEEAKEMAETLGLNVECLRIRDGWQFYERNNKTMYNAWTANEVYCEDNTVWEKCSFEEFAEREDLYDTIKEFDNFDEIEAYIASRKEVFEEIEDLGEDEVLIEDRENAYTFKSPKKLMKYREDVWEYVIAVVEE